ncbi:MAG: serine hydrolase domain-containing protein [Gemmatimonadaceae bacterium]
MPASQRLSPGGASDDLAAAQALVARFDALRQTKQIPGLAIAIVRDTTVLIETGLGVASIARGDPVTAETPFNIASVTKTISGVVALRLAERGTLDLDRPMSQYDGFAEFCVDVRGAGGIFFGDYGCADASLTLRHVLSMEANGVPGTRFLYNPPSFSWASRPMMQVTGRSFSDLTAELVLVPAGMLRSARMHRRLPLRDDLARALATPYHVDSAGQVVESPPPGPQGDGAAGGIISTAHDLARFDVALTNDRLLSPASRQRMWTAGRAPSGAILPYGIGWFVQELQGETLLWHSGLWEGAYSAIYLRVPDRRLTLILLANSDGLWWNNPLDAAMIERSPFVQAFLAAFPR